MRTLVFTDLDGTLLDESYSWRGAKPALAELPRRGVPLILCTSKTRAEVQELRRRLGVRDPYSVENGGLVVVPRSSVCGKLVGDASGRDRVFQLGKSYPEILEAVRGLTRVSGVSIRAFHQMSAAELARATGLTQRQARLAQQREASEPFRFRNATTRQIRRFVRLAAEQGFLVQRGGTFWHLSAGTDKGLAVRFLTTLYQLAWRSPVRTIALGDAPNDVPMLAAADVAILLASPTGRFDTSVARSVPHLRKVGGRTPDAWSRAVLLALQNTVDNPSARATTGSGTSPVAGPKRGRSPRLPRLPQARAQFPRKIMKRA